MKPTAKEIYARLYDVYVPDWPGELDFYRSLLAETGLGKHGVLEIACGTGRVAVQLARDGVRVVGLDHSQEFLDIARQKSQDLPGVRWVLGDMRTFELDTRFGVALVPGHSFQFMNTSTDQVQCLEHIKRHLVPGGVLVVHIDHQDITWLSGLITDKEHKYQKGRLLTFPGTARKFRQSYLWTFEPSTQTATVQFDWEEVNAEGEVIDVWKMEPMPFRCVFRFEMEHLLERVGFSVEALYGDFSKGPLTDTSGNMVWVARNAAG